MREFRRSPVALAVSSLFGTAMVFALASPYALAQEKVERVEVTGSIIKQRMSAETALPVTVVTREDIQRAGVATTADLVNTLPLITGGSFTEGSQLGSSALGGHNSAGLRGLGGKGTLVLLNGRRLASFAFQDPTSDNSGTVDLNSIPLSAIERIEILRDGASSTYGTDAIAGVINFILKDSYQGAEASLTHQQTQKGGGGSEQLHLTGGVGNLATDKWNVFANYSFVDNQRLRASDRDFSKTAYIPGMGVNKLSSSSFPSNYALGVTNSGLKSAPGCPTSMTNGAILIGTACRFDYASVIDSLPQSTKENFLARGNWNLSNDHRIYAETLFTESKYRLIISPPPAFGLSTLSGDPFVMPASSKYNPFGQTISVRQRILEVGGRTDNITADSDRYLVGAKGTVAKWDYDTTLGYSRSVVKDVLGGGWVSESRFRAGLASGQINGLGATDPSDLGFLLATQIKDEARKSTSTNKWVDVRASRELGQAPGGPIQLGLGAEMRKESLDDRPSPILATGDIIGQGGNLEAIKGDRDVKALFGEVNVPVVKNLDTTFSLRYDKYSDFGSTTNPKVAVRFQPVESLLLRGSYGTGFRAPQLSQLYSLRVQTTGSSLSDPLRCGKPGSDPSVDCNAQFNEFNAGNRNLKPEKSESFNLGFVWAVTREASLGVAYWKINRSQNISVLSDTAIFGNYAQFGSLVTRFPRTASDIANGLPGTISGIDVLPTNLGKTAVDGLDIDLNWQHRTADAGRFRVKSVSTYISKYQQQLEPNGPMIDFLKFPQQNQTQIQRWRHNAALLWDRGPWNADLSLVYIGKYPDENPNTDGSQRDVAAWMGLNAGIGYTGIKNLTVRAGVKNLLDAAPPFTNKSYGFAVGWDENTHDPRGRMYLVTLAYKFK